MGYYKHPDGMSPQGEEVRTTSLQYAYFIADDDGHILTSIENPERLEWTLQASMEDAQKSAVAYKNPFHIPKSISRQIPDHFIVYKVEIFEGSSFATYDQTLNADFAGMVGQFKPTLPGMDKGHKTDFVDRAYSKR